MVPIALYLIAVSASPAVQDDAVELRPRWAKSDLYEVELHTTERRERHGRLLEVSGEHAIIEVEVLSARRSGAQIRWTWLEAGHEGELDWDRQMYVPLLDEFHEGLVLEFRTDGAGDFHRCTNVGEVANFYRRSLTRVVEKLEKSAVPETQVQALREGLSRWTDKEQIELLMRRFVHPFLHFRGAELEYGSPWTVAGVFVDEETGLELPSRATYTLDYLDEESGTAHVILEETLDRERAGKVLKRLLEDRLGGADPTEQEILSLQWSERTEVQFDTRLGLPVEVRFTRTTVMGGQSTTRVQAYEVRKKAREEGG